MTRLLRRAIDAEGEVIARLREENDRLRSENARLRAAVDRLTRETGRYRDKETQ